MTKNLLKTFLLFLFLLPIITSNNEFAIELEDLFDISKAVPDLNQKDFLDSLTPKTLVKTLGFGWNLGNTLDAWTTTGVNEGLESETVWGNPYTTEKMIDALVAKGFKSIRIPVTWHNHLVDDKYTIDTNWMKRVREIVDWCIKKNLYVILNTHHDNAVYKENVTISYGEGYYPLKKDMEESERFLYNIWKQICFTFNNGYDHHLIFEGMNEPRMINLPNEWWYLNGDDLCEESVAIINQYNKLIVKAIRSTGGNNKKRFIMVTGHAASYDYTVNSNFQIPDDDDNKDIKRILVSVHMYAPYEFVMEPNVTNNKFTESHKNELYQNFKQLYKKFVQKGNYVVIGEMGIVNKNNTQARIEWGQYYLENCRNFQMSAFLWDNGLWDNTEKCDDTWAFFRRSQLTWENGVFIDAVLKAAKSDFKENYVTFTTEPIATFNIENAVVDYGNKKFDATITSKDIIDQIGFGWNLGNTFDAVSEEEQNEGITSETSWGNPKTTVKMFSTLLKKGIKAIRIPVTWHNHLVDEKYTIDPEWMHRIKTVVDWAIDKGFYVILNTHHDQSGYKSNGLKYGQGYYPLWKDAAESEKFLYNVWKQITLAFNNGYDHHLIFEGLNEPRLKDTTYEWWYNENDATCKQAAKVLNEYNKLILKTIRDSKGNNNFRYVMTTALSASLSSTLSKDFVIPDDFVDTTLYPPQRSEGPRILVSVHMYSPYDLAMNPNMTINKFTDSLRDELYTNFKDLYTTFVQKGYNVIIGEMGIVNKNNTLERINWANYFVSTCRKFQFAPFLWDNNNPDNSKSAEETYGFFNRTSLEFYNNDLMNAFITSSQKPLAPFVDLFETDTIEFYDKEKIIIDQNSKEFHEMTSEDLVDKLGLGWNLGNTLDALTYMKQNEGLSSETSWGNPKTTQEMILAIVKKGFKSIRIPVTWHNHLIDEKYTIDPEWMKRVKEVVDWAIGYGLYVIINTHHDNAYYSKEAIKYGQGYYPLKKDINESEKFLYNIWKQITYAFNNGYDEKLIFEGLNEPRTIGLPNEWSYKSNDATCKESASVLNEYNRLCVKAIRESGGNNEKRFIMVTGLAASYDASINSDLEIPDDKRYNIQFNKILLSVHMYIPYEFAMLANMTINAFTTEVQNKMYNIFKNLYFKYIKKGTHVVVGEMGAINKNNTDARIAWGIYYLKMARRFQFSAILWDNGKWNNTESCDGTFGHFIREELSWENDELIDRYINAVKEPLWKDPDVFHTDLVETFEQLGMYIDYGEKKWNDSVTSEQIVEEMGLGINLGNALDAYNSTQNQGLNSEIEWGNPITTEELINSIVDKGFSAIRIPVTWHNHLVDEKYTIDPLWMARVKTVVDWCINKGLYVILNTHHDNANYNRRNMKYGNGYYPLLKDIQESEKFLYNIWKQISYAFNNGYDHHLVFEGLNEPRLRGLDNEWWYLVGDETCEEAADVVNEYNKLIVKAVRETGGNNALRFIMVTPLAAGFDFAINSNFVIPDDSKYNPNNEKMIVSIHLYSPYNLVMNKDMNYTLFTTDLKTELNTQFQYLNKMFVKPGYNVIIGEFGSINKNNTEARTAWGKHYITAARKNHMTPFLWDNGIWDNKKGCDNTFGNLNRNDLTWVNNEMLYDYLVVGDNRLGTTGEDKDDDYE